ncbi:MAG: Gfo/Idh/MocA family oxidoreductase [Opitutae bacterium]|nr:Gfo/Idh/MocA family oxidoreductase [Opitutae bacterium]
MSSATSRKPAQGKIAAGSDKVLKVAIVGLGHLHPRSYMPLFAMIPATRAVAVVEQNAAMREAFAKEFGVTPYADLDAMLKKEKPDIAAIFLPHVDCATAAIRCAEKGVHVMVEKPVAASANSAQSIVTAVRRAGLKMTTGYCWRLHPVAREIKRLIASGVIGEVIGGEGRCAAGRLTRYIDGNSPWMLEKAKSGGGPIYNLGVHWIDLFRWMLQDEVAEVSGRNVKINTRYDIEDNSFAHLQFAKGATVALDISYTVPDSFPYGRDLYISIRGTRGVLSWSPAYEGQKDVLHICSDDPSMTGSPRRAMEFELEAVKGYSGYMGREYIQAFAQSVLTGNEPPITGEDGVAALRVVEAVYQAAAEKRWVAVKS